MFHSEVKTLFSDSAGVLLRKYHAVTVGLILADKVACSHCDLLLSQTLFFVGMVGSISFAFKMDDE